MDPNRTRCAVCVCACSFFSCVARVHSFGGGGEQSGPGEVQEGVQNSSRGLCTKHRCPGLRGGISKGTLTSPSALFLPFLSLSLFRLHNSHPHDLFWCDVVLDPTVLTCGASCRHVVRGWMGQTGDGIEEIFLNVAHKLNEKRLASPDGVDSSRSPSGGRRLVDDSEGDTGRRCCT
jgi:hypothetical protein